MMAIVNSTRSSAMFISPFIPKSLRRMVKVVSKPMTCIPLKFLPSPTFVTVTVMVRVTPCKVKSPVMR